MTAYSYEPENAKELAEVIRRANNDDTARESIAARAEQYVKHENNERVMAERIEETLKEFI